MIRTRPTALIALAVALPAAAMLGVQLGQSAIAQINPVHFRDDPAPRAVDSSALAAAPVDPYAQAYGWDRGNAARAVDCGGTCDAGHVDEAQALAFAAPARSASAPYWRDVTPDTELRPWPPGAVPNRGLSVERYMHYPVQAEAAAAPDDAPVADTPPPAADGE